MNLRAALSEGGGRKWPPGRQLPTPGIAEQMHSRGFEPQTVVVDTGQVLYLCTIQVPSLCLKSMLTYLILSAGTVVLSYYSLGLSSDIPHCTGTNLKDWFSHFALTQQQLPTF